MNDRKQLQLVNETLDKATEQDLSAILPKLLTIAKIVEDKQFEKWVLLETTGYFDTNPAMSGDVKVPDYRKVPGQFHDRNGNLLVFEGWMDAIVNNYPIREGVAELEHYSKQNGIISVRNSSTNEFIKKNLSVEVDTFSFTPNSLKSVLSEIRNKIIHWLMDRQKQMSASLYSNKANPDLPMELSGLHPIVQKTAGELFGNGHYRQAILDTYIALVDAVKVKSTRYDLDNTPLMQTVFSPKSPKLVISEDADEQQGFMWLFSGAVMGIRNPKAHRLVDQNDPQRTLEWLSFASVLLRVLDDSQLSNGTT